MKRNGSKSKSFKEILSSLKRGGQFVVCLPSRKVVDQLSLSILSSAKSKKAFLLSAGNSTTPFSPSSCASISDTRTLHDALRAIRRHIYPLAQGSLLVVDLSSVSPKWLTIEKTQRAFLSQMLKGGNRKQLRTLYLTSRFAIAPAIIREFKEDAELFLDVNGVGSFLYAQFLTAKGVDSPAFFMPRLVSVSDDGVELNRPLLPATITSSTRYQALLESTPNPQAFFENRKLVLANKAFRDRFPWLGYGEPKAVTLSGFLGRKNSSVIHEIMASVDASLPDDRARREVTIAKPDGERCHFELSVSPVSSEGKDTLLLTLFDVTDRNASLQRLEETERKYRSLVETTTEAVSVVQLGRIIYVNSGFLQMFGYASAGEVLGCEIGVIAAGKKDKKILSDGVAWKGTERTRFEYSGLRKDGTKLSIEASAIATTFDDKNAAIVYHRDGTEQKRREDGLEYRVRGLEVRERISTAVNGVLDPDELWHTVLQTFMKELTFEVGALYVADKSDSTLKVHVQNGLSETLANSLTTQSMQEGITGYVVKTLEPLVLYLSEYPPYLPYKALLESEGIQTAVYLPIIVHGNVCAILMLASKKHKPQGEFERQLLASLGSHLAVAITNAATHAQVKESEAHYRSAVEDISDVVYNVRPDGSFTYISPKVEQLLGFKQDDFYRSSDLWRTLLHPDDRARYAQRISNQTTGSDEFNLEYRMLPKGKATYRWVRDSVRYRRDEQGNLLSINGILSDVTDRMLLEDALLKSEELKANVLESVQEGVLVLDTQFRYIDWNKAMEHITGITREQVLGRTLSESTPSLSGETVSALLQRALAGDTESSDYIPFHIPNTSEESELWARFSPLRNGDGRIMGVVGIMTDVTNRRRLERDLRESEETLRNVIDALGDALMISDLQGKVWEVNKDFSRITGYPRNEVLGLNFPYPWLVEEEMAKFVMWISELRERSYLRDFDMTWRRKDGQLVAISLNTTLLRNALDEPVAMLNIGRDISDRKRLSLELQKKNRQIELLNRIIGFANSTSDFERIFETIAAEVHTLVPFDGMNVALVSEDQVPIPFHSCGSPLHKRRSTFSPDTAFDHATTLLAIHQGEAVIKEDGEESTVQTVASQITIPIFLNEKIIGTFTVSSNTPGAFSTEQLTFLQPIADQIGAIIDRVRLFQKVSDDSNYIHNLLNSINSVVYTVDSDYRITEVNKAWRDFVVKHRIGRRVDEQEIIGRHPREIIPDPRGWDIYQKVTEDMFEGKLDYYASDFQLDSNGEERIYHLVINPMVINGKVTGLVFTHTDITDIKRTEAEIKRRNKELVALNAISSSISTSLQLDAVLRVASEQIRDTVGADIVLFYVLDEPRNELVLARHLGISTDLAAKITRLDASSTVTGSVIASRRPHYITTASDRNAQASHEWSEILKGMAVSSLGAIPLQSKDKVLGIMDVAFLRKHDIVEQEQQLLLLIGNQVASAVENAQLYSEVQEQVQRITTLYELGRELAGVLDIQAILGLVHEAIRRALPVDRFEYYSYAPHQETLVLLTKTVDGKLESDKEEMKAGNMRLAPDASFWKVVKEERPFVGVAQGGSDESESVLAVPMKSKQKVVGVLSIAARSATAYDDTRLRVLESIANLAGIAIEKATLYEDTVNKSIEIENRNKELDDFTYVVSHDLKEPLISIEGYSKILLREYTDKIDEEGKEYFASVVQSTSRMKNLIEDLLTLSRLGRISEAQEIVSVDGILSEILHDLQFTLRERNVAVTVQPGLPDVRYNKTRLSLVFRNLISNAMKFNDKPNPTISVSYREEELEYVFSVADNGIGIEREYFDKIFMIFQRLRRSEEFRGTGAGLTIVKRIVEKEHGRIWVDSELGVGTTFYFTIPKP